MARPRIRPLPSIGALKATFRYDPDTGNIYRLPKPGQTQFNARYCANPTGGIMNEGYLFISYGRDMILAHRLAWALHFGVWPETNLDHRDTDKLNNRIKNHREASARQNSYNIKGWSTSGYKGVSLLKGNRKNPFAAQIGIRGQKVNIGYYPTPELAAEAYANKARALHGDFAFRPIGTISATITFNDSL